MAIQKAHTLSSGVIVDYHRVFSVPYFVPSEVAVPVAVTVAQYVNKAARDAGLNMVQTADYTVMISKEDIAGQNILEALYEKLMLIPEFEDGVEV